MASGHLINPIRFLSSRDYSSCAPISSHLSLTLLHSFFPLDPTALGRLGKQRWKSTPQLSGVVRSRAAALCHSLTTQLPRQTWSWWGTIASTTLVAAGVHYLDIWPSISQKQMEYVLSFMHIYLVSKVPWTLMYAGNSWTKLEPKWTKRVRWPWPNPSWLSFVHMQENTGSTYLECGILVGLIRWSKCTSLGSMGSPKRG